MATLLVAVDTEEPRPCLAVFAHCASCRVALQALLLRSLAAEAEEDCAEDCYQYKQTEDRAEEWWQVGWHAATGLFGPGNDISSDRGESCDSARDGWVGPVVLDCLGVFNAEEGLNFTTIP